LGTSIDLKISKIVVICLLSHSLILFVKAQGEYLPLERMCHYSACSGAEEVVKLREHLAELERSERESDPSLKKFNCSTCRQELRLSPIEILKHKKKCKS